jgi:hypothetical protein
MNRIIEELEAEIQRLQSARALLDGETNSRNVGKITKRKISAAGQTRITAAQKARLLRHSQMPRQLPPSLELPLHGQPAGTARSMLNLCDPTTAARSLSRQPTGDTWSRKRP